MNSFIYYNPTKIIFGENVLPKITAEIPGDARVLMTYGGGSIKQNGIYDQVLSVLKDYRLTEFAGIEPNPEYSTLMKAVNICREEKIDFLLAVGGGSVLDGTKFISAAVYYPGDPWDLLEKGAKVSRAVPFGTVLTLPATGSEMNPFAVISRRETGQKLAFGLPPHTYPRFSVLDPSYSRTLPQRQRANGIVDAFVHVTEQYLTYPQDAPLHDRFAESILKTLIELGPQYVEDPENITVAKNVWWCTTMALNGIISAGLIADWATHSIGHEITAFYGVDHARTLAIVWPGMMKVMKNEKRQKLLQYAARVWEIHEGDDESLILKAIEKTESFFHSIGVPTRLSDYQIGPIVIEQVVSNLRRNKYTALGEKKLVTPEKVREILSDRL